MILGLCSQMQMGKDTMANMIEEYAAESKQKVCRRAFAEELKTMISYYYDLTLEDIEEYKTSDRIHPKLNATMRKVLQTLGETFRSFNKNVWVSLSLRNAIEEDICIFTDVRYENEAHAITESNGKLILIGRSVKHCEMKHPSEIYFYNAIQWFLQNTRDSVYVVEDHKTETPEEFRMFYAFVRNDSDLKTLQDSCRELMERLREA